MRPIKPKPPTEAERAEALERNMRWNRQYAGLDMDGAAERARQLAAMPPKPPAFAEAPSAPLPTTKRRRPGIS